MILANPQILTPALWLYILSLKVNAILKIKFPWQILIKMQIPIFDSDFIFRTYVFYFFQELPLCITPVGVFCLKICSFIKSICSLGQLLFQENNKITYLKSHNDIVCPLKISYNFEILSSPHPFLKIWLEVQPPLPQQKGEGAHYVVV